MKKLVLWFETIFESVITDRNKADKSKSKDNKHFLQFLLELMQQGDDRSSFTMTELEALFTDIIVGGTDSTSTTLEWALVEILKHPEVMVKIHELERVVGNDNIVEESHIPNMPYLQAIINETFRLHPALPLLGPHSPSVSSTIAGYRVPRGARVFFNVWEMQRDPEAWSEPLEFQPERFLQEPGKGNYQVNNFNFLPFGFGRRICAGIPLVVCVLATLLHSCDWKLQDGTKPDLTKKFGIVLKKMTPLMCIPAARLSTAEQYY